MDAVQTPKKNSHFLRPRMDCGLPAYFCSKYKVMGRIKGHSLIKEVPGSIGQDVYMRKSGDNAIISRKGLVRRSSKGQQANRQRFVETAMVNGGNLV